MTGDIEMAIRSRGITMQDMELAREIFSLGVEVAGCEHNDGLDYINYQKSIILGTVNSNPPMSMLLKELFESGRAVGEKRKRKRSSLRKRIRLKRKMPNT